MDEEKRKPGRPPGTGVHTRKVMFRATEEEVREMDELARDLGENRSETIRRAVKLLARQPGRVGQPRKRKAEEQ